MFLSDEGPSLETLDFTFYIGSTPTFLYFDLHLRNFILRNFNHYNTYLKRLHTKEVYIILEVYTSRNQK